ncbi:MAG: hypothetical protein FWD75_09025, partial [Propionibacteriaceae bacterium]|nr:hypothetical protein [Propionibacteriaceae bacterium]
MKFYASSRRRLGHWRVISIIVVLAAAMSAASVARAEDVPPVVSWSSPQEMYFSPNGDGQEDSVSWAYWLSQAANVDAWVTDDADATVRVLESGVSHPATSWYTLGVSWDGMNDAGVVVPDGVYVAHMVASDASGVSDEISVRVGVDTRVPGVMTSPAPGDAISGSSVGWVFTPTAGFVVDAVQVICDGGSWSSAQAPALGGPVSGTLDASSCSNGENQVSGRVSWTDGFGWTHSWSFPVVPVTVVNPPAVSWSSAQEVYFSPNGDGQNDSVSWSYWLSQPADV